MEVMRYISAAKAIRQDQDRDGIHALANGVLEAEHQIRNIIDGRLEQIRELFKNCLFLRAALHSFIELISAVFRVRDRALDICGQIFGNIVCNMRTARNYKGHSNPTNARIDAV